MQLHCGDCLPSRHDSGRPHRALTLALFGRPRCAFEAPHVTGKFRARDGKASVLTGNSRKSLPRSEKIEIQGSLDTKR